MGSKAQHLPGLHDLAGLAVAENPSRVLDELIAD
jgi:hypothetical protein